MSISFVTWHLQKPKLLKKLFQTLRSPALMIYFALTIYEKSHSNTGNRVSWSSKTRLLCGLCKIIQMELWFCPMRPSRRNSRGSWGYLWSSIGVILVLWLGRVFLSPLPPSWTKEWRMKTDRSFTDYLQRRLGPDHSGISGIWSHGYGEFDPTRLVDNTTG